MALANNGDLSVGASNSLLELQDTLFLLAFAGKGKCFTWF